MRLIKRRVERESRITDGDVVPVEVENFGEASVGDCCSFSLELFRRLGLLVGGGSEHDATKCRHL